MERPSEEESQEELQPERIRVEIDGEERWVSAYTLTNAAKVVGRTYKGFQKILETHEAKIQEATEKGEEPEEPIVLWKPQIGKGMYILDEDLKRLMLARPVRPFQKK